jgi:hypothetical protein
MVEGSMNPRVLRASRVCMIRFAFLLAPAAMMAAPPFALAQNAAPATVIVGMAECTPPRFESDALWKALQVELAALGVEARRVHANDAAPDAAANSALATVAIACADAGDGLSLRVSDAASGKELTRTLAVGDVAPAARSRALALAVVALLESSWSEVVSTPNQTAASEALPPWVENAVRKRLARKLSIPAEPEESPFTHDKDKKPPPPPAAEFEISAAMRAFPGRDTGTLGVQLGLLEPLTRVTRLIFNVEGLWGRDDLSDANGKIGVVNLYWLTGGAGLSFHTDSHPDIECGPRLLIGYAIANAHATREGATAKDASGGIVAALLAASIRAQLGSLSVLTGADIGYTLVGVAFLGDQARLAGMADTTFMLRTGLAW